ncbi:hypothetical protein MAXJ12_20277 [Mesorhizobium alhagi CCNWXJ12-2]|jgi:hypothetical protein|uniref:Uncharacterized protein n=1 Tax=Mesorhizobium alhagi CCNWXJ12-2 TaxID=1107882 RepID=H0HV52_9HYPH|nr:hypothetical protein MAXJ12_20277 [Mesorhizobium alhagi CCNWXJ12-2]
MRRGRGSFQTICGPGLIDEATDAFLLEGLEAFIRAIEA